MEVSWSKAKCTVPSNNQNPWPVWSNIVSFHMQILVFYIQPSENKSDEKQSYITTMKTTVIS